MNSTVNENRRLPPFGWRDKIGYLLGNVGNDFTFAFAGVFLLVFYTKVLGIPSELVGTMFLLARFLDAFTDITMGRIVDISRSGKVGKFRPWLLRMSAPVAIASFLMYQSSLADASMGVKIAYMFVTYLVWGSVFYTAINIPYGSMASVISNEADDRAALSTFRSVGSVFANIAVGVIAPLLIYASDSNGNQIYYNNDGSIAYDKINGEKRVQTDSISGEPVYRMYSDEKIVSLKEKANDILLEADEKGINGFDVLRREYSNDYDAADTTDGMMYYSKNVKYSSVSSEFLDEIVTSLAGMEIGDVKLLESDISYNIIIRTELGAGAYNDEKFTNYFSDETYGVFDFIFNLKNELYAARLANYISDVVVDEELLEKSGLTIKTAVPNFYYPDPDIAYHFYDKYE